MALESIGPYDIVRKIGAGAMGEVYEAVHNKIRRRAAIKLLRANFLGNPDVVKRFFNEALAVNVIEHPGLVQVYEHGQLEDGRAYLGWSTAWRDA